MELFNEAKGYASRTTALAKLAKVFPEYNEYRYMLVALPTGRFLPVVQLTNTKDAYLAAAFAGQGIGVM